MTAWKKNRFGHPGFHKQTQDSGSNLLVLIMLSSFNNHVEGSYHVFSCATLLWSVWSVVIVSAIKISQQVLLNLNALLVTPFLFACCCVFFGCCSMCSCHWAYFWSVLWNIFLTWPIRTETCTVARGLYFTLPETEWWCGKRYSIPSMTTKFFILMSGI